MLNIHKFLIIGPASIVFSFFLSFCLLKWIYQSNQKNKNIKYVNEKDSEHFSKPVLGGVGIFVAYFTTICLLVFFTFLLKDRNFNTLFIIDPYKIFIYTGAISFIFILGLIDDFFPISVRSKLITEVMVASILFLIGFKIKYISIPLGVGHLDLGIFSLPLTILWIVGIINAINLIDGIDALAGGIVTITSLSMIIILVVNQEYTYALLLTPLLGGTSGFLPFNRYPAKILMGDNGSLFCGTILSVTVLPTPQKAALGMMIIVPLVILALPILDTSLAIIRRISKGKSPFKPDRDHIHHRFLKRGYGEKKTARLLIFISIIFSTLAIMFHSISQKLRSLVIIVFFLIIFTLLSYLKYIHLKIKK